jgi:hypothetical protein
MIFKYVPKINCMKNPVISLVFLMAFGSGCHQSEKIIGLHENIHHDDLNYRVIAVEKRNSIVADSLRMMAGGTFYIVTFEVENNARRVGHIRDNNIAYVISEKGCRYENNFQAQQLLNIREPFDLHEQYNTGHGSAERTRLVFDIPGSPSELYLKVKGETLMGDVLNLNRFKHIKIKLL